jgi:HAD superfamily hydrolase (TIGR01549 family)
MRRVFQQAGVRRHQPADFLHSLQGSPLLEALERLKAEQNIKDDLFLAYRRAYWLGQTGAIDLFPGVREMLEVLRLKKIVLGIVTQKARRFNFEGNLVGAEIELETLGILDYFSVIIGFEDVSRQKPDPSGVFLALKTVATEPQEAVVVGDSGADMQAARSAGCRNCLATWGIVNSSKNASEIADNVAGSPDDVVRLVNDLS